MFLTAVYLGWDRFSAMADAITRRNGLEVPFNFEVPQCTELPDTMPRFPRSHDRYYTDGGTHWPNRQLVELRH